MELDSTFFSAIRLDLKRKQPFTVCPGHIFFPFSFKKASSLSTTSTFSRPVALEASVKSMAYKEFICRPITRKICSNPLVMLNDIVMPMS